VNPLWIIAFLLLLIAGRLGALRPLENAMAIVLVVLLYGGFALGAVWCVWWFYTTHPGNVRAAFGCVVAILAFGIWPRRVKKPWEKTAHFEQGTVGTLARGAVAVLLVGGAWFAMRWLPPADCLTQAQLDRPVSVEEVRGMLQWVPAESSDQQKVSVLKAKLAQRPKCPE
jgi:hypothetical protein